MHNIHKMLHYTKMGQNEVLLMVYYEIFLKGNREMRDTFIDT